MLLVKIDEKGEIPGCEHMSDVSVVVTKTNSIIQDTSIIPQDLSVVSVANNALPQDTFLESSIICESEVQQNNINIDIKPGNKRNVINPRAKGGIWVAILSNTDPESPFDPLSQVDIPTVEFGPDGAKAIRHKAKDKNKDGLGDLLLRFKIPATGIACGDNEATLIGETFSGQSFTGTDSVKTVGCKSKKHHKKKHHKNHK